MEEPLATWRQFLNDEMKANGDGWHNLEAYHLRPEDNHKIDTWLDEPFDDGYGGNEGVSFILWTHTWVYFPINYDGAEWVGSVPRFPPTDILGMKDYKPVHHGGG